MNNNSSYEKNFFIRKFYKDNFEFIIESEDKSIFEDIQKFISFDTKQNKNMILQKLYLKIKSY